MDLTVDRFLSAVAVHTDRAQTEHLMTMYIDIVHWPVLALCCLGGDVTRCAGEDLGVRGLRGPVWLHCTLCLWIPWRSCGGSYYLHDWHITLLLFLVSQTKPNDLQRRVNCVSLFPCFSALVHPWSPPLSLMTLSSLNVWAAIFTKYKSRFKSVASFALDTMGTHVGISVNIFCLIVDCHSKNPDILLFVPRSSQIWSEYLAFLWREAKLLLVSLFLFRGDIVIAKSPSNPKMNICKRVIGLEGDKVSTGSLSDLFKTHTYVSMFKF